MPAGSGLPLQQNYDDRDGGNEEAEARGWRGRQYGRWCLWPEDRQRRSPPRREALGHPDVRKPARVPAGSRVQKIDLGLILAFRRRTDTDGVGVLQRERALRAVLRELRVFSLRKSRGAVAGARLRGVSNGRHEVLPQLEGDVSVARPAHGSRGSDLGCRLASLSLSLPPRRR